MGKLPPLDLRKIKVLKLLPQGETSLSGEAQQARRPCWHSSLGSHLKISVISYTTLGLVGGDASPQETKPTAAHECICANSILSLVQTGKEWVCHAAAC